MCAPLASTLPPLAVSITNLHSAYLSISALFGIFPGDTLTLQPLAHQSSPHILYNLLNLLTHNTNNTTNTNKHTKPRKQRKQRASAATFVAVVGRFLHVRVYGRSYVFTTVI